MTCDLFRKQSSLDALGADALSHLRSCGACLDHTASLDPTMMFRLLGGEELVPPGGLDSFVDEVVQQVQVRRTAQKLARPSFSRYYRGLAVAASLLVALGIAAFIPRTAPTADRAIATVAAPSSQPALVRPIVDSYDSVDATIVEVPSSNDSDLKIVMIFDETLPVDL